MLESITGFSIQDLIKNVPGIGSRYSSNSQNGHIEGNVTEAESPPGPVAVPPAEPAPAGEAKPEAGKPAASAKPAKAGENGKKSDDV